MSDRLHSFTLGDVIRENARWLPQELAVVCGDHRLTYPEIDERVNRVASLLRSHGVGRGDRVVWLGLNCHRLLEVVFACAKLGAIATPVNWRLSAQETAGILDDLQPRVVISGGGEEADAAAGVRSAAPDALWLEYDDPSYDAMLAAIDPVDPELDDDDERPVLQIMTAAFGGRPQGALLTSRGIVQQDLVLAGVGGIQPGREIYLACGPMFHIGVLLKTFALFHWGGRNIIVPRVDAEELCRLVDAERCTSAFVFAPTIKQMVEVNADRRYDLSTLEDTLGGVPTDDVAADWYDMTSCPPPGQRGAVGYGTTETVGMVTYESRLPPGVGTFGRPSPAMAVRIVDSEGRERPPNEIGEIVVRGPQVMAGYFGQTPQDPDGWRNTGDLGRREADGTITFLGPNQEMIKTAMENVYPVEVENVLREHPMVRAVCVIGVPDEVWGQSVRAVVEPEDATNPTEEELIEFVRERIASYKKPKSVKFVEALPRANGFVDRAAVKAAHGEGDTW